jgi:hypothetical protein
MVGAAEFSSILSSQILLLLEVFFNVCLLERTAAATPGMGGDITYLTSPPLPVGGGWVVDPEFKPSSIDS